MRKSLSINKYNLTLNDLEGQISGFPLEVISKMMDKQREQGEKPNHYVFVSTNSADTSMGGFNWNETPEGDDFWSNVILERDFDLFFEVFNNEIF